MAVDVEWLRARRTLLIRALVLWAVWLVSSATLLAAPAAAQGTEPDAKNQIARDLFERGKAKWAASEYDEAAALLAASHHLVPRAGTLMLLGDAEERLGRLRSARDAFQGAAVLARANGEAALEYRANTRDAALVPRLPRLEIRVPLPAPRGLVVTRNGAEVPAAELNAPIDMDAGSYRIDAGAPGYKPFSVQLVLSNEGQSARAGQVVVVLLVPDGERAVPEPEDPVASRRQLAWWVGGASGVLVLASVVSMIVAVDKNSSSREACGLAGGAVRDDENACNPSGVGLRKDARMLANLATVGGVLGLAGVGTGVALHLSAGSEEAPALARLSWSSTF
jgi:hypothetical protein